MGVRVHLVAQVDQRTVPARTPRGRPNLSDSAKEGNLILINWLKLLSTVNRNINRFGLPPWYLRFGKLLQTLPLTKEVD